MKPDHSSQSEWAGPQTKTFQFSSAILIAGRARNAPSHSLIAHFQSLSRVSMYKVYCRMCSPFPSQQSTIKLTSPNFKLLYTTHTHTHTHTTHTHTPAHTHK